MDEERDFRSFVQQDKIDAYREADAFFYEEVMILNEYIRYMDEIVDFPFDVFVDDDLCYFFNIAILSFGESVFIRLARMLIDTSGDSHTLRQFKNQIRKDMVRPDKLEWFDQHQKSVNFDKRTEVLLEKADLIRDKYIAHSVKQPPEVNLGFEELHELRDALNCLYDALFWDPFGIACGKRPEHFSKQKYMASRCPERILDFVAISNPILRESEEAPAIWLHRRQNLDDRQRKALNHYRQKFGLSVLE